jgi:hypothetical protein
LRPDLGAGRLDGDRPVIKPPVWTPEIPMYFYVGGLAGASAGFGLLSGARGEHAIARRAWAVAFAGSVVSPALLISDLGVPRRFLNMLRMVKVTSPMSIGSWILVGFGATTAPAAAHAVTGRLGTLGRGAQAASAVLGLGLSSYTGALIANTSVPVWHDARAELPAIFCAGAATSAGAALTALSPVDEAEGARRLAVLGAVLELAGVELMTRHVDSGAYHDPPVRGLKRAATALTAAGALVIAARGRRSRAASVAGGLLLTLGAVAERSTIFRAGARSAERPQDTVGPQRARIEQRQPR